MAQEPATLITDVDTAVRIWEILQNQYQGSGHNLKQSYLIELQSIDFKQFNSIPSFIIRFKTLVQNLANIDMKLPDDVYTITFINALTAGFPIWSERQRSLARTATTKLTLEQLYIDITDEARQTEASTSNSIVALYANKPKKGKGRKSNKDKVKKERQTCTHCDRTGHTKDNCWKLYPEKKPLGNREKTKEDKSSSKSPFTLFTGVMVSQVKDSWLVDIGVSNHVAH